MIGKMNVVDPLNCMGYDFIGEFPVYGVPGVGEGGRVFHLFAILETSSKEGAPIKRVFHLRPEDDVIRHASYKRNGYAVDVDDAMGIDDRRGGGESWFGPLDPGSNYGYKNDVMNSDNEFAKSLLQSRSPGSYLYDENCSTSQETLRNKFRSYYELLQLDGEQDKFVVSAPNINDNQSINDAVIAAIAQGLCLHTGFSPASLLVVGLNPKDLKAAIEKVRIRADDLIEEGLSHDMQKKIILDDQLQVRAKSLRNKSSFRP
jgi:hypothetical protein